MTTSRRPSELAAGRKPQWIELDDTAEAGRKVYYNPVEEKIQWEPCPEQGVEQFDEEVHWQWRVVSSVAISTARNSRDTKVKMARAFYERGEWQKAAVAFEKAITIGCGRQEDAMRDYSHVRFVLWDMSDGDADLLKIAFDATKRSFELGVNAKHPLSLLMAARLYIALGQPDASLELLLQILAVRYHGDALHPNRVWSIAAEVDQNTLKLTTKDVAKLPRGARLSRDGRSALMVCRRFNVTDHSAFSEIEASVLHTAWCVHSLGQSEAALQYFDFLSDVPPVGVPGWVLPLLSALLMHWNKDAFKAMAFMESGLDSHAAVDGKQRILSPKAWFESSEPWAVASQALLEAGFPQIAAAAYAELARRLGSEAELKKQEEQDEKEQTEQEQKQGQRRPSHLAGPVPTRAPLQAHGKAHGKAMLARLSEEADESLDDSDDDEVEPCPADVLYKWALAQMLGGRPLQAVGTMARLLAGPNLAARYDLQYRATAAKWQVEWSSQFAREEKAAVSIANESRRFAGKRMLCKLRDERKAFLVRMKTNAEVLADFLVTAKNRGQKMTFRAWKECTKKVVTAKANAVVMLQCWVRQGQASKRTHKARKRRALLTYAFAVGSERQSAELTKRCVLKLKLHAWLSKAGRAAVKVQSLARGRRDRKRAKLERAVAFMRGRSGRYLLTLHFGAWSKPKKNRKRRLAATTLQRVWRGVLARRVSRLLSKAKHVEEAKVMELYRGGLMKTGRRCFQSLQKWPAMRPSYEAACQCQRRRRGKAGRAQAFKWKVEVVKARAALAKAIGYGTQKLLKRCFKCLRIGVAVKVLQRAWRTREARVNALRACRVLRERKARVKRFMRQVLGEVALRCLYAWSNHTAAMWQSRHDGADALAGMWRCSVARATAKQLRSERQELEKVVGLLLHAQGAHWKRKCFRAWFLRCQPLRPGGAALLKFHEAQATQPVDFLWLELVWDKAALVLQCVARGQAARLQVGKALSERRHNRKVLMRVFGAPVLKAKASCFRDWRRVSELVGAARLLQRALRTALAIAKMGYRQAEVARRRALRLAYLKSWIGGRTLALKRAGLRSWKRCALERKCALVITAQARKHLQLTRGKRHATALWLYALVAWKATLTRRRERQAAAGLVGQAWRAARARRKVRHERQLRVRWEECVRCALGKKRFRALTASLAAWNWERTQRQKASLTVQCWFRCWWAVELRKRRSSAALLLSGKGLQVQLMTSRRLVRKCFLALWSESVGAQVEAALKLKSLTSPPLCAKNTLRRLPDFDREAAAAEAAAAATERNAPPPMSPPSSSLRFLVVGHGNGGSGGRDGSRSAPPLVVPSHASLVAFANLHGTTDGVSRTYHDARARAAATGVFVWAPPPPQASSPALSAVVPHLPLSSSLSLSFGGSGGGNRSEELSAVEAAAVAFDASVLLVEKVDPTLLLRLTALLRHKLGYLHHAAANKEAKAAADAASRLAVEQWQRGSSSSSSSSLPQISSSSTHGVGTGCMFVESNRLTRRQQQEREQSSEKLSVPLKIVVTGPFVSGDTHSGGGGSSSNPSAASSSSSSSSSWGTQGMDRFAVVLGEALAVGLVRSLSLSHVPVSSAALRALATGIQNGVEPAGHRATAGTTTKTATSDISSSSSGRVDGRPGAAAALVAEPQPSSLEVLELKGLRGVSSSSVAAVVGALCVGLALHKVDIEGGAAEEEESEGDATPLPDYFPSWLVKVLRPQTPKTLSPPPTPTRLTLPGQPQLSPLSSGCRCLNLVTLVLDDTHLGDSLDAACAISALLASGAGFVNGATGSNDDQQHMPPSLELGGGRLRNPQTLGGGARLTPIAPLRNLGLARCGLGPAFVRVLCDALKAAPHPSVLAQRSANKSAAAAASPVPYTPKLSKAWAGLGVTWGDGADEGATETGNNDGDKDDEEGGTLQSLWLNGNPLLGDSEAEVLAGALASAPKGSQARSLTCLDLSYCGLGDAGAVALARCLATSNALLVSPSPSSSSSCCPRLRSLCLRGNLRVHDAGAVALGRAASDRATSNPNLSATGNARRMAAAVGPHGHMARTAEALGVKHTRPPPEVKLATATATAHDSSSSSLSSGWLAATHAQTLDPYRSAAYDAIDDDDDATDEDMEGNGGSANNNRGQKQQQQQQQQKHRWVCESDAERDGAWRALLAIDVQVRARASRRAGSLKWKYQLSSRQRLALARQEMDDADEDRYGGEGHNHKEAAFTPANTEETTKGDKRSIGLIGGPESSPSSPAVGSGKTEPRKKADRSNLVAVGQATLQQLTSNPLPRARSSPASLLQVDLGHCLVSTHLSDLQVEACSLNQDAVQGVSSLVVPAASLSKQTRDRRRRLRDADPSRDSDADLNSKDSDESAAWGSEPRSPTSPHRRKSGEWKRPSKIPGSSTARRPTSPLVWDQRR